MDARQRKKINAALQNTKDMQRKLIATQEVLSGMPDMAVEYAKQMRCSTHQPCGASICRRCATGVPLRAKPDLARPASLRTKANKTTARANQRNYRSRGGCWLSAPFVDHAPDRLVRFSLHFSLVPMGFDAAKAVKRERERLRKILAAGMPGAVLRMLFDIDPRSPKGTCSGYPDSAIDPSLRGNPRPDVPAYLFHAHGVIYHPTMDADDIRALFNRHYPGRNRVCISKKRELYTDDHGNERGGIEGWGEYAAMEKIVVSFPDGDDRYDNVAVAEDMIRIRKRWPRKSRRMSYGDRRKAITRNDDHGVNDKLFEQNVGNAATHILTASAPTSVDSGFGLHQQVTQSSIHTCIDHTYIYKGDDPSEDDTSLESLDLDIQRESYLRSIFREWRQRRTRGRAQ
jgi:hypothetical protein